MDNHIPIDGSRSSNSSMKHVCLLVILAVLIDEKAKQTRKIQVWECLSGVVSLAHVHEQMWKLSEHIRGAWDKFILLEPKGIS